MRAAGVAGCAGDAGAKTRGTTRAARGTRRAGETMQFNFGIIFTLSLAAAAAQDRRRIKLEDAEDEREAG